MNSRILFILCLALAASCKKQVTAHLPKDRMQQVLFDVHLAEAYSLVLNRDSNSRYIERDADSLAVFYRSVFKHHRITKEQFEQSLGWYKKNPEELDSIYSKMIPEMSKLEGAYAQ